ncbi:MAG: magnesium-translocating P-type ATPase, partial [Syntrophomonadaceae bacterium]|nr:magnesium-translocating P-type ATPase [Syntrophomonadaceae bacterium]
SAGAAVPADCRLLEARALFVDEAVLTGESMPVEKRAGTVAADAALHQRSNVLFMGTHVVSGTGVAVAVVTGRHTEYGAIAGALAWRPPETEFERGVRRFGYLLMEITFLLVICIFAINVYLHRPILDSFLFALALAVGLTPQLLPAIISVNLAQGARRMAEQKVIVKRLAAIENFGSMNVLCSDKTGTLTRGTVDLQASIDACGNRSEKLLYLAYLNAVFQSGYRNPIDEAISSQLHLDTAGAVKLDEVPYDFVRKRLSVLVQVGNRPLMITKGALARVVEVCGTAEVQGRVVPLETVREELGRRFQELSTQGLRVLGVACREMGGRCGIDPADERDMVFVGMLALGDTPREGIAATVGRLEELGVRLKIVTGDNPLVAAAVAQAVGMDGSRVMTGRELQQLSDEALVARVEDVEVFAEVEPNQKERVILALRKAGNVVGYLGDGINDASALHAADVGISVAGAVDVAREAADFVLLEQDLGVLAEGIRQGRVTFANTLKYVFMATSANFGNMFSMAGASLFLPFLPLLPQQVLLTNLLTDIPEMTIATDNVDTEMVEHPHRWNIDFVRRFMVVFGLLSSVFDYLTFAVLLLVLQAGMLEFRAGWFTESVISASAIVLVVRSRGSMLRSRPSRYLLAATGAVAAATLALPLTPLGAVFGFVALPAHFYPMLALILLAYVAAAEVAKRLFYRAVKM